MANKQRYRSGPVAEAQVLLKSGDTNEIGDIMGVSGNYTRSYDALAAGTSTFHDEFLGVLQQGAGTLTADGPGLVYTSGEFEFDLDVAAAAISPVGTPVGFVSDQTVNITGVIVSEQMGVLARATAVGDTTCLVRIKSVVMDGGMQNPA